MTVQTDYEFTLPRGYLDGAGRVHRAGCMRLATARDEVGVLQDPRVENSAAYLPILLLARVVTRLGDLPAITTDVIADLFAIDMAYLQDLYQRVNCPEPVEMGAICPACGNEFRLAVAPLV